tara:strand:+ start:55 stop:489 length:435 start_codon:yes stop_codon:yes gene_type:complete
MTSGQLNAKQEAFAKAVVLNGGDKVKARAKAGYSVAMSNASQGVDADKLYNHAKISLRITILQKEADLIAKKMFSISVEQRLKWLKDITEAGLDTYNDAQGNKRREGLGAARSAIETMNTILGTNDNADKVKPVKVFVGVQDAS